MWGTLIKIQRFRLQQLEWDHAVIRTTKNNVPHYHGPDIAKNLGAHFAINKRGSDHIILVWIT